jgi:hypothetical protein
MKSVIGLVASYILTTGALADNSTLDAAIGGGIGGAAGAAIGNEIGGRDGAIIGGAIGGAAGVAVATEDENHRKSDRNRVYHAPPSRGHSYQGFCPPGQQKKGRC